MAQERLSMRKIREVLRLRFAAGLSARRIALSIDVARSTVSEVLQRASDGGLGWPLPPDLDDAQLEARLYPSACAAITPHLPDFAHVHRELARPGVTRDLRAWEITLAPSVGAALAQRLQGTPEASTPAAPAGLFGISDPRFTAASDNASLLPRNSPLRCLNSPIQTEANALADNKPQLRDLPRLSELGSAVAAAAARWPRGAVNIAEGSDATEAYLWQHRDALAFASVVLLGTHGLRGAQDLAGLDQPALALAPGGGSILASRRDRTGRSAEG